MFLPGNQDAQKREEDERKKAFKQIEQWGLEIIPEGIRGAASVSVQEIQCGDPQCAPIDTAVTIIFERGGEGLFGIPMEAKEVTSEILKKFFPTQDVLEKWHKGEEAEWPPLEEEWTPQEGPDGSAWPALRFEIGTKVLCRIGPDAEKDWAAGTIIQLWYRERNWPQGSFAPYKIELNDGRVIFAPGDMDQIIRKAE